MLSVPDTYNVGVSRFRVCRLCGRNKENYQSGKNMASFKMGQMTKMSLYMHDKQETHNKVA